MKSEINCPQCGNPMRKSVKFDESDYGGISLIIGLCAIFFLMGAVGTFSVIGIIIGFFFVLLSARVGFNIRNVWQCKNCSYHRERE